MGAGEPGGRGPAGAGRSMFVLDAPFLLHPCACEGIGESGLQLVAPPVQQVTEGLCKWYLGLPTGGVAELRMVADEAWNVSGPEPIRIHFDFDLDL
jgi:hypothetical protein